MLQWFQGNESMAWWLGVSSILFFIASLIAVPWLAIKIPPDYFIGRKRRSSVLENATPAVQIALKIGRNILGVALIAAGVLMLVLPGQGVLAIVAGLMLTTFPGKRRLMRWIVARKAVRSSINAIRRRAGREPLVLETRRADGREEQPR